ERRNRREAGGGFGGRRRLRRRKFCEDQRRQHRGSEAGAHGIQYIVKPLEGVSRMRQPRTLIRGVLAGAAALTVAATAIAQTGRVGGTVKDETGQPIKGATITAENPNASPSSFTATTDDKGRFSIIGLRTAQWTFTAQAPGFSPESGRMPVNTIGAPNPPLTFTLKKGGGPAPAGALGGIAAKDLQAELAIADQAYNAKQWDDAIAKYQAILAKAPSLTAISLQIAQI